MIISPLSAADQNDFIRFSDRFIGSGYFHEGNFREQIELSQYSGLGSSFTLKNEKNKIVGIRLTYAPGAWPDKIKHKYLAPYKNKVKHMAYFKSLFIDPLYQGHGWGPQLSQASLAVLKKMGATQILTHSWLESPHNSSVRYLEKYGFKALGEIKNYWAKYNYLCSGCQVRPCLCTAVEMIYEMKL